MTSIGGLDNGLQIWLLPLGFTWEKRMMMLISADEPVTLHANDFKNQQEGRFRNHIKIKFLPD